MSLPVRFQDDHMLNASDIRGFSARHHDILLAGYCVRHVHTFISGDHQPRAGVDNASEATASGEAPDHRMHRAVRAQVTLPPPLPAPSAYKSLPHRAMPRSAVYSRGLGEDIAMRFAIRDMFTLRRVMLPR